MYQATSLLNPDPNQPFTGTRAITSIVHTTAIQPGGICARYAQLGSHWDSDRRRSVGPVRRQVLRKAVAPASAFNRVDQMPSWRAAVVYKPVQAGSIYFDAGTSFNPSAESLALSAGTADLPPEKNRTYEVRHQMGSAASSVFRWRRRSFAPRRLMRANRSQQSRC